MSMQPCLPVPRKRARKETASITAAAAAAASDDDAASNLTDNHNNLFDDIQNMDASEYLRRVVEQAEQIPEMMIMPSSSSSSSPTIPSQVDEEMKKQHPTTDATRTTTSIKTPIIQGSAASLHYLVSHRTALQPPPTARHAARRAWVDHVLENFSRLRSYLDTCIDAGETGGGVGQERKYPLPALKDRPGWLVFCIGQDEADGNVGSYFDDDNDDDDNKDDNNFEDSEGRKEEEEETPPSTAAATSTMATTQLTGQEETETGDISQQQQKEDNIPLWKQNLPSIGYTPTVELVGQMDQVMIRRVLGHLVHYILQGWSLQSNALAGWIYALLARLARPLHRDEACLLYQLLKQMTQDRSKIDCTDLMIYSCSSNNNNNGKTSRYDAELAHLNLLISIVGIYFEQGGGYDAVMRFPGMESDDNQNT